MACNYQLPVRVGVQRGWSAAHSHGHSRGRSAQSHQQGVQYQSDVMVIFYIYITFDTQCPVRYTVINNV